MLSHRQNCIQHFLIDHNAHCSPPKFYIAIVFELSWDNCNIQEKLETMVMQFVFGGVVNGGGGGGGGKGALWSTDQLLYC